MAFPTIPTTGANTLLFSVTSAVGTTHTSPSLTTLDNANGDLLIEVIVLYQPSATGNTFGSWGGSFTEFGDSSSATNPSIAMGAAYKISDGTETGTFTVTSSIGGRAAMALMSIKNWHGTTVPEIAFSAATTATAQDPPNLDPTGWGSENTLWIAVAGGGQTSLSGSWGGITSAPANYTDYAESSISGGDAIGACQIAVAFRGLNVTAENPGSFTTDTSPEIERAATIAIRPAATPIVVSWNGSAGTPQSATEVDASQTLSKTHIHYKTLTAATEVERSQTIGANAFARSFALSSNDFLRTTIGNANLTGALTIAALCRISGGALVDLVANLDNGYGVSLTLSVTSANKLAARVGIGVRLSTASVPTNEWVILAWSKGSGTVQPKLHIYSVSGGWVHETSGSTLANPTSQADGYVSFAESSTSDIALVGEWNIELSQAQIEELSSPRKTRSWKTNSGGTPVALWPFNRPVADGLKDITGGGADQTQISGTTLILGGPANWDYRQYVSITPATETETAQTLSPRLLTGILARKFVGADGDRIYCSIGACNITGAYTIAALIRRVNNNNRELFINTNTSGGVLKTDLSSGITPDNLHTLSSNVHSQDPVTMAVEDGWVIAVVSKASGLVYERCSIFRGGNWYQGQSDYQAGNQGETPGGTVRFADLTGIAWSNLEIAVAAIWTTNLSDAEVQTLSTNLATRDWLALNPAGLWQFNQVSEATPIVDLTKNGADQSSISGTSVFYDGPADWNYPQFKDLTPATETETAQVFDYEVIKQFKDITPATSKERSQTLTCYNKTDYAIAVLSDSPAVYWRGEGLLSLGNDTTTFLNWELINQENLPYVYQGGIDVSGNGRHAITSLQGEAVLEPVNGLLVNDSGKGGCKNGDAGGWIPFNPGGNWLDTGEYDSGHYQPLTGNQAVTFEWVVRRHAGKPPDDVNDDHAKTGLLGMLSGFTFNVYMPFDNVTTHEPIDDFKFQVTAGEATWSSCGIGTGEIHHVALRFNPASSANGELAADTAELFIDGVSKGTRTQTGNYGSFDGLIFGALSDAWSGWFGEIDEPAMYLSVLPAARIQRHAQIALGISLTPIIETDQAQTLDYELTSGGPQYKDLISVSEVDAAQTLSKTKIIYKSITPALEMDIVVGDRNGFTYYIKTDYTGAVIEDNPMLYWKLDEPYNDMTVRDYSGHNRTGGVNDLYYNEPGLLINDVNTGIKFWPQWNEDIQDWEQGSIMSALLGIFTGTRTFEGVSQKGEDPLYLTPLFTGVNAGGPRCYIPFGTTDVSFRTQSGTDVTWSSAIPATDPFHWALTFNGTDAELFIDGVSKGIRTPGADWATSPGWLWLGLARDAVNDTGGAPNGYGDGKEDEFAIYDYVLSSARILRHAQIARGIALNSVTETNTVQSLNKIKAISLTSISETNAAQTLSETKTIYKAVDSVAETDTAQTLSITHTHLRTVTPVAETDTAQTLSSTKTIYKAISSALETDSAQTLSNTQIHYKSITTATETDSAQVVSYAQAGTFGITAAVETDSAQILNKTQIHYKTLTSVSETDTAQVLSSTKTIYKTLTVATETDSTQAFAVTKVIYKSLTTAAETDSAIPLSRGGFKAIVWANETDAAQPLRVPKLSVATETTVTQPLSRSKRIALGAAVETDSTQTLLIIHVHQKTLTFAPEIDSAQSIVPSAGGRVIEAASEVDRASSLSITGGRIFLETHPELAGIFDQSLTGGIFDAFLRDGIYIEPSKNGIVKAIILDGIYNGFQTGGTFSSAMRNGTFDNFVHSGAYIATLRGGIHDASLTGGKVL